MKKVLSVLLFVFFAQITVWAQDIQLPANSNLNFAIISDFGRNGYYNQKEVADMMTDVSIKCGVKFFVTGGDNFQVRGVQSTQDPLWMTSFENIYTHPITHVDWYPALGNHDYSGNVQAQVDYSKISRRWRMPATYYTVVRESRGVSVRLVILDTQPMFMAFKGRSDEDERYSMEAAQKQLAWTDSVLTVANEDWVVVVGHHPVYSAHPSRKNTEELVEHLNPILKKHHVDFYVGSHDHIFQHQKSPDSQVDYFVNTAGSQVRDVSSNDMTIFSRSSPGFSLCSATKDGLSMYFVGIEGKALYHYTRKKE